MLPRSASESNLFRLKGLRDSLLPPSRKHVHQLAGAADPNKEHKNALSLEERLASLLEAHKPGKRGSSPQGL
jgi:hypothetical protein